MTNQKIYNMVFKKILDTGHIKSPELIEFVRETVDEKECRDTELAYILELITKNPNISSGTQMKDDTALFMEFWWCGPDITIIENNKDTREPYKTLDLFDQAISIVKSKKRIGVQDLIIEIGRINRNALASDIIGVLRHLEYNKCGIRIDGCIYPYDDKTEFYYNELPTLEEFVKDHPHIEVVNKATKSEPKYICPECGGNVRKRLDLVLTSNPVKYRYECDNNPNCTYVAFHEM